MEKIDHVRVCPTRIDGETALFAHKVTVDKCNDRQRGRYHKCYTCAYNHSFEGTLLHPEVVRAEAAKAAIRAV